MISRGLHGVTVPVVMDNKIMGIISQKDILLPEDHYCLSKEIVAVCRHLEGN